MLFILINSRIKRRGWTFPRLIATIKHELHIVEIVLLNSTSESISQIRRCCVTSSLRPSSASPHWLRHRRRDETYSGVPLFMGGYNKSSSLLLKASWLFILLTSPTTTREGRLTKINYILFLFFYYHFVLIFFFVLISFKKIYIDISIILKKKS